VDKSASKAGAESVPESAETPNETSPRKGRGGPRPGAGRKLIPIDPVQVAKLRALGCTVEEIADFLGLELRTLQNRLRNRELKNALTRGIGNYKLSIRAKQMELLRSGSVRMAIHLGRTVLTQREPVSAEGLRQPDADRQLTVEAFDELLAIADEEESRKDSTGAEDEGHHE
jgi:hypothetical protein